MAHQKYRFNTVRINFVQFVSYPFQRFVGIKTLMRVKSRIGIYIYT